MLKIFRWGTLLDYDSSLAKNQIISVPVASSPFLHRLADYFLAVVMAFAAQQSLVEMESKCD